ncbi:uncharacterized protein LOC110839018 isoform X2 [Zootermopsis nevadensis]|uniref:uncharacterized protein LOC110839018 isoform X2 n=1 Tax=Zootermopsis nevadensis TaxID=136037 RepID=UPI000B8EB48D|nr:uncharacterized protein LOC110839018 isoform X2 [Zootermopsis nevadensis]
MEPLPHRKSGGMAPILGWSNDSPSLSPALTPKTPATTDEAPTSPPNKSVTSSGIGQDVPSRTVSFSSNDFSPTLSSIGCEPPALCPSTPSAELRRIPRQQNTGFNPPPPTENGNVLSADKPPLRTVITENPIYDGAVIKFQDDNDVENEVDSIFSSDSSSEEEEEEEGGRNKVPDGGWGWVVVLSSLVISMVADGISFSFGLLYIEFLEYFGESKSKTAWIGSLFMAVPLLSGPIGSALVDRYGCRTMTIIGGIISGIGFTMSAFVNSIELLYTTFGLIAGLGLGLCYVTAVVSIAYWFDKKRALATGLGACGTGIGTFVYAPMTQFFIEEYGWRGTVLLLAGTFFNMCVCGAVMRDPEWWIQEQKKSARLAAGNKSTRGTSSCGSISGRSGVDSDFPGVDEIRKMLKSGQAPEYLLTVLAGNTTLPSQDEPHAGVQRVASSRSVVNLPTYINQKEKVPLEVLESLGSNKRVYNVILENYPSLLMCRSLSDNGKLNTIPESSILPARVPVAAIKATKHAPAEVSHHHSEDQASTPLLEGHGQDEHKAIAIITRSPKSSVKKHDKHESGPTIKKQIFAATQSPHYLQNIRVHRNSVMYRGAMLNIHKYRLRASSCPDIYRNSMTTIAKENEEKWYADFLDLLKDMVDFSMFLEWHFLLLSLGTILLFTWFIIPYFYLAELMVRNGYTEQEASTMLSIIGFTNFLGMNYWLLAVTVALFGAFFASSFSFTPPIVVQLIPLERFTTAYGLVLLCQGIGNLLGPPLGGLIFDITLSWDLSFYVAGVWIVVAGVLIWLIPVTKNRVLWGSGSLYMDVEEDKTSIA